MTTLATLVVKLVAETNDFNRGLDKSAAQTKKFMKAADESLKAAGANIKGIMASASTLVHGMGQVIAGFGQLGVAAGSAFLKIAGKIPILNSLGQAATRVSKTIREGLSNAFNAVSSRVSAALAPLNKVISGIGEKISAVAGRVGKFLAPFANSLKTAFGGLREMASGAMGILGNFGGLLGNLAKAGLSAAGALASKLAPAVQNIGKFALASVGIIGGALVAGLVAIGPQAINAASNYNESLSKVQVVFGESAGAVEAFSKTTAASMGISQRDALAAAGTFGNLFRTMGLGNDVSAKMSTGLVGLSADLASFNNLDPTEVLEKLRSGLVGETEPLRSLGINLTDAAVRTRAVEMGLAKTTKEVDQAAMTQARFALIMEQSSLAQGDFARTSDGLANQQRILGATWQDILQKVGTVGLPFLTGALGRFLNLLQTAIVPAIDRVVDAFNDFQYMLGVGVDPLSAFKTVLERFLPPEIANGIVTAIQNIVAGVQQLIAWATPIVTQIAAWVGENVKLQDVLIALGAAIASVIIPAILAFVAPIAGAIATFALMVAAVAALRAAWETDFLGIRTALEGAWAAIQPALTELWTWLQTNIPLALQALSDLWTGTLLPAITAVWDFTNANIVPLLTTVGDLLSVTVGVAATALAGIWENVLLPALQSAGNWISTTLGPILNNFTTWLGDVSGGVDGISTAFQKAIDWIERLIEKIKNVELPDWMTPGSPTPLELGLIGIAKASQMATTDFSRMQAQLARMADVQAGGMAGGQTNNEFNLQVAVASPQQAQTLMDNFAFRKAWSG